MTPLNTHIGCGFSYQYNNTVPHFKSTYIHVIIILLQVNGVKSKGVIVFVIRIGELSQVYVVESLKEINTKLFHTLGKSGILKLTLFRIPESSGWASFFTTFSHSGSAN